MQKKQGPGRPTLEDSPLSKDQHNERYRSKQKAELEKDGLKLVRAPFKQTEIDAIKKFGKSQKWPLAKAMRFAISVGLNEFMEKTLPIAIPSRLKEISELVKCLRGEHAYAAQLTKEQPTDPNTIEKLSSLNKRCKEAWEITEALMKEDGLRQFCTGDEFSEFLENYEYVNQLMLEVTELLSNVVEQMRLAICEPQQEVK